MADTNAIFHELETWVANFKTFIVNDHNYLEDTDQENRRNCDHPSILDINNKLAVPATIAKGPSHGSINSH